MKKTAGRKSGFTLIELLIAMGISFLLLIVLYYAYSLSGIFIERGTNITQNQSYVRTLFSKITEDLQFANRLNALGSNNDEMEFEIFNRKVLEVDKNSNDKVVEGNTIVYSTKPAATAGFIVLLKKTDKYKWMMKFGHSQKPNDDVDPKGYPDDMRNSKQDTEAGQEEEVIEQDKEKPFLLKSIKFTPYDKDGKKIESNGYDYTVLKAARSMRVEIEYVEQGEKGEAVRTQGNTKKATENIIFTSFSMQGSDK